MTALGDIWKSLGMRESHSDFQRQFSEQSTAASTHLGKLDDALKAARNGAEAPALTKLEKIVSDAKAELEKHGELSKSGWKFKGGGASTSGFNDALKAYNDANGKLEKFLTGVEDFDPGNNVAKIKVGNDLKNAFKDAKKSVGDAKVIMDGMFGRLRVNGFGWEDGIKKTAQHNFNQTKLWESKFWEKGGPPKTVAFARVGGVAAGSGLVADAFLRGKNGEGEDRSWVVRVGEGVAGVGLGAGSILAGKAL